MIKYQQVNKEIERDVNLIKLEQSKIEHEILAIKEHKKFRCHKMLIVEMYLITVLQLMKIVPIMKQHGFCY